MTSSPTLLLTAAGTGTAYGYALAFAQCFPSGRLITADTNPVELVSAACFADSHVQVPAFTADETYLGLLSRLIQMHGVSHYLPIIDPEIEFAAMHRRRLRATVLAPDAAFVSMAMDKGNYPQRLGSMGIVAPAEISTESAPERLPLYAKLRGGFGGRGSWRVESIGQLKALPPGVFLQEQLAGPEFTVDCFPLGTDQKPLISVRERLEVKAGVCTKARITPHPVLEEYASRLAASQLFPSPFCFQAIGAERPAVTDINPRLGAGTAMSGANGMDFFAAHLSRAMEHDWQRHMVRVRSSCTVTRQYVDYLGRAE